MGQEKKKKSKKELLKCSPQGQEITHLSTDNRDKEFLNTIWKKKQSQATIKEIFWPLYTYKPLVRNF